MLRRKKSSYFEEKLVQNSTNSKMLWKTLKFLGLNFNKGDQAKVPRNKDGTIQFEPRENTNICKKFCPEVANTLVQKLPPATNIFN